MVGGMGGEPRKPFSSREEEAFLALLRTADQLARRGTEMLKPHGLSPTQYNALRVLRGAGAKGLTCSQIGERMINHDPPTSRVCWTGWNGVDWSSAAGNKRIGG